MGYAPEQQVIVDVIEQPSENIWLKIVIALIPIIGAIIVAWIKTRRKSDDDK